MDKYRMDCGCEFDIIDPTIKAWDGLPHIDVDIENPNYNCQGTWNLFLEGNTKGIFQLESFIGKDLSAKIKPCNEEELSAVSALLRPGPAKSGSTQKFVDRKNLKEEIVPLDQSIADILDSTFQLIVYQEQSMKVAQRIAGFDLQKADNLRKAMGSKDSELMAKVGKEFMEGCKNTGIVSEEKAKEIWDCIKTSERYSFNKSHSLSYAILGYWTAYLKFHFPKHFFRAWLTYAKEKIKPKEEIKALVANARRNNIEIFGPKIQNITKHDDFAIINNEIYFGARNVKQVGDSQIEKIRHAVIEAETKLGKCIDSFTWTEFLLYVSPKISTNVLTNLILVGACQQFGNNRQELLFQYEIFKELTETELNKVKQSMFSSNISDILTYLIGKVASNRKTIISGLLNLYNNPTSNLVDNPLWIIKQEEELLGTPVSLSILDTCDKLDADTECKDFENGKTGTMVFSVELKNVKEHKIKNGDNAGKSMGFLSIGDSSGELNNVVVFNKEWEMYKSFLYPENIVTIVGERSKTNSLMVKVVKQL